MDKATRELRGNGKDTGAPIVIDALTPTEIEAIEELALDASDGVRCASAGELGDPGAVMEMLVKLTRLQTTRPWVLYHEIDGFELGAPSVLDAYLGNGPGAEANARFFAMARACVLALIVHARKLEQDRKHLHGEIDKLASCILEHHPGEIVDGSAVDVAVQLLTPIKVKVEGDDG